LSSSDDESVSTEPALGSLDSLLVNLLKLGFIKVVFDLVAGKLGEDTPSCSVDVLFLVEDVLEEVVEEVTTTRSLAWWTNEKLDNFSHLNQLLHATTVALLMLSVTNSLIDVEGAVSKVFSFTTLQNLHCWDGAVDHGLMVATVGRDPGGGFMKSMSKVFKLVAVVLTIVFLLWRFLVLRKAIGVVRIVMLGRIVVMMLIITSHVARLNY